MSKYDDLLHELDEYTKHFDGYPAHLLSHSADAIRKLEADITITIEVPKADVWLRNDYRDIVRRLGEVHMVRACEHQHDDDFVPMYDYQTIEEYQKKVADVVRERDSLRQHLHDEHQRHIGTMDERDAVQHLFAQQERHRDELLAENEALRALLREAEPYARVERWGKPGCNLAERIDAFLAEKK